MGLTPYKFTGQLIAHQVDDDGNVVGEIPVAGVVLFAHQFDQLSVKVAEYWPEIEAEHEAANAVEQPLTP